jgi:hypothetical protein
LTAPTRYRIAKRFRLFSVAKNAAAFRFLFNAFWRSPGTSALLAGA